MALILGIESTCDETACALVEDGLRVRSEVISSQVDLHQRYGGVVPEIASRAHIEKIIPVIEQTLLQGGYANVRAGLAAIDAVAVAHRPGLIGSLLIGVTAAKTLAWALGKPLIGVDHVQAHLYSVMLDQQVTPRLPAIGLVASGGHTALYHINSFTEITRIGGTIDDAVGEAYDKVSAILRLGYPGGPVIDRLSATGNPAADQFPRTLLGRESLDFSFSGLKTAVLYRVRGFQGRALDPDRLSPSEVADIAASFQAACVDTISKKLQRALQQTHAKSIIIGGGVSANRGLRDRLAKFNVPVYFPLMRYCTDNAGMSAGLAHLYYEQQQFSDLGMDAITFSQM